MGYVSQASLQESVVTASLWRTTCSKARTPPKWNFLTHPRDAGRSPMVHAYPPARTPQLSGNQVYGLGRILSSNLHDAVGGTFWRNLMVLFELRDD